MKITVTVKDVYGQRLVYPADETARRFAAIAGSKTLTEFVIGQIKHLGYSIEVEGVTL